MTLSPALKIVLIAEISKGEGVNINNTARKEGFGGCRLCGERMQMLYVSA